MGFSPEEARLLATKTVLGAAKMLSTSSDTPRELRGKVTSPGGTTQAAVTHLDAAGVGPALVRAIRAAEQRSRELRS
jgi:pyrroline-5-carboxylate reductase